MRLEIWTDLPKDSVHLASGTCPWEVSAAEPCNATWLRHEMLQDTIHRQIPKYEYA